MEQSPYDVAIVGAGIVGLSTALMLCERHPKLRLVVVEKEDNVGLHQTGHNSGVIHGGIYYKPGSLKARLCVEGGRLLTDFCERHGIHYERCGKVIVATHEGQLPALDELVRRGRANGVPGVRRIGPEELREIEPHASGVAALHSPHTAIVDYRQVAGAMAGDLRARGVCIRERHAVTNIVNEGNGLRIVTDRGDILARNVINCAGLYSDAIAQMMGLTPPVRIVPFRGEYYFLRPERQSLVRGLIYPVADPALPFLGVHFTRTVHGRVEAGPNAVLALAREGYTRTSVRVTDLAGIVRYPGFWRLAARWWRTGIEEYSRSFSKHLFAASLRQLVPDIQSDDLIAGGAGVRAQAVARDGSLVDDFAITTSPRAIHVLNAPSPAATASLAIGNYLSEEATRTLDLL